MENNFNFWMPIDIQKSGKGKTKMRIKGIASTADIDTDEEILEPGGFVLDRLVKSGYFNYDHRARENPMYIVGEPDKAEIRNGQLYVEGDLYDTPLGKDIFEFANLLQKSGSKRRLGFSIEGKALERDPFNNKRITKALLTGIAITPSPKNSNTLVDVVKGNVKNPFEDYEFDLEKGITGDDVIYEKIEDGVRFTIDKDLRIIKKAISTETHGSLLLESLEGANPTKVKESISILRKAMSEGKLTTEQIEKFKSLLDKINGAKEREQK
jgi:hypothetical protein